MVLTALLEGVRVIKLYSGMYGKMVLTQDISVRHVRYDSRQVGRGDMFIAIRGTAVDGHRFILDAMQAGASVIVVDDDGAVPDSLFMHEGILKILVPDARIAMATISANFHGRPSERLKLIGVTGTNGKTTTTHLLKSVLEAGGEKVGLLGTIEYRIGERVIPATHTTPESLELNEYLAAMVAEGCTATVMEVSSHALAMHRVAGLSFHAGVFTNLTQDHLDYHITMEAYFRAKKMLFDHLGTEALAVVNSDDASGSGMLEDSSARRISYGTHAGADVRATNIRLSVRGSECTVVYAGNSMEVRSPLTGRFNVANILAAYATGVGLGIPALKVAAGIGKVTAVRGRFEPIISPAGWTAIIDYAHTPDALENCLRTIHDVLPAGNGNRVITVFGCGGNRDRGKRPIMGRIASEMSDITIVTSDNPRNEDPRVIIDEVMAGARREKNVTAEPDRRKAIRLGLEESHAGDVVLIAGKGHETYQVIGTTKHHFDDREEVEAFIRNKG